MRGVELDLALVLQHGRRARVFRRDRVRGRLGLELLLLADRLDAVGPDAFRLWRAGVCLSLELRLRLLDDRLLVLLHVAAERELLVRGNAAVARARQGRVRAALPGREHGGAAAGELGVALVALAREGRFGLLGRELGVGLDVDLPAGEAGGEAGVHALLADRKRELVVGHDDRRVACVVVQVDLAHAGRRQRLGDEARGLRVPRDDVDLLAAELGDDHAHARATRADASADRVDPLGVRLDGDLRAVPGLAGDGADLDQAVRDLRDLELEQRPDQLRVAAREDHLRALRPAANLGDDGLDAGALLVALAVDLLGARQQRLDLAEVDEHVVAVAGLLDDPGHDLGHAVDVLVVHDLALGLADALRDHLLRRLRGDAAEVLRCDVGALDLLVGHVGPVDVEVLVGDEHVRALAVLGLGLLELGEHALARLLEQPLLDVGRELDREHAEVALVAVQLDHGMAGRARRLLVRREQRVLERRDQRVAFDASVALELVDELDDLPAHRPSFSSIRLPRTIWPYGMSTSPPSEATVTVSSLARVTSPRSFRSSVFSLTCLPSARWKCCGFRSGRSGPGEETSTPYSRR